MCSLSSQALLCRRNRTGPALVALSSPAVVKLSAVMLAYQRMLRGEVNVNLIVDDRGHRRRFVNQEHHTTGIRNRRHIFDSLS